MQAKTPTTTRNEEKNVGSAPKLLPRQRCFKNIIILVKYCTPDLEAWILRCPVERTAQLLEILAVQESQQ